ncbi:MAG TPA: signal peptidase I [Dongiaceae bacterium]|jgi:signal peptidase I|nr:signal peptidase I [Dongiaceae bacterium]
MILRWLLSTTVRNAVAMRKHVYRMLCAQRDLLTPAAMQLVSGALLDLQKALHDNVDKVTLKKEMTKLEQVANKWLKPYPHATIRENVEVLLVALAVAMAIRTFFVQPFKIPTGSMQPTLYGVTSMPDFSRIDFSQDDRTKVTAQIDEQLKLREALEIPTGWQRVKDWIHGSSYVHVVAQADGVIDKISPVTKFLIFNIRQSLWIGGIEHTIWFPPDYGESDLVRRAGLPPGHFYHKGDDVVKLQVNAGDHLFVDRLTYNFRKPQRGEIIVFETAGISEEMRDRWHIPIDEFYIKRLVGLPGDKMQIGDDRHLRINGQRLDASTPHFENVYGFDPDKPPHESQYSGHVNGTVAQEYNLSIGILPLFPDAETVYDVPANSFMPMGDNTCNSLDSRFFGAIPENYAIGKSFFVYWPITERFGIGHSSTAQ